MLTHWCSPHHTTPHHTTPHHTSPALLQGKEYIKPHLKNKEAIKALCKENLGVQWPPPPSTANPFFTERLPAKKKKEEDGDGEDSSVVVRGTVSQPPPDPIPCIHEVMDSYMKSDGKLKLKSGVMGSSRASWHDNVKTFIEKHDKILPKPRRGATLPPPGPNGASQASPMMVVSQ